MRRLLEPEPSKRPSCSYILKHDWLHKEGVALDVSLDSIVLKRMGHFANMSKMKKLALMVVGQNLSPDEVVGLKELFRSIDADDSGSITIDELRAALQKWDHKINQFEVRSGINHSPGGMYLNSSFSAQRSARIWSNIAQRQQPDQV